jgi:hypothetical protein
MGMGSPVSDAGEFLCARYRRKNGFEKNSKQFAGWHNKVMARRIHLQSGRCAEEEGCNQTLNPRD